MPLRNRLIGPVVMCWEGRLCYLLPVLKPIKDSWCAYCSAGAMVVVDLAMYLS